MATLTIADLDNGKRDLQTVSEVANSRAATATTRFGQQTTTLYEAIRRINVKGDEVLSNLGFRVPVPYASGLNVTDSRFTVTGTDGKVYAPLSAPFTTGAWNPSQWYVLQNDLNDHKLLIFDSLVAAQTAATVLPDEQRVQVLEDESTYTVASGLLVFQNLSPIPGRALIDSPLWWQKHVLDVHLHNDDGSGEIYPGASRAVQGLAILDVAGVKNAFLTQRPVGTVNDGEDERCRVLRVVMVDDGSEVPVAEYSNLLNIGHGEALGGYVDSAGNVKLYSSLGTQNGFYGTDARKGVSRIDWIGASTSDAQVTQYPLFGKVGSGHRFQYFNSATVGTSEDGEFLLLIASNTIERDSNTVFVYSRREVEEATDSLAVNPVAMFRVKSPQSDSAGRVGVSADKDGIYIVWGTAPTLYHGAQVYDWNGKLIKDIDFDDAREKYSQAQMLGSDGNVPVLFELEGASMHAGQLYFVCMEGWRTQGSIVSWIDGKNYACIVDTTPGVTPYSRSNWVPTNLPANSGAFSYTATYTRGTQITRYRKSLFALSGKERSGYTHAIGKHPLNTPPFPVHIGRGSFNTLTYRYPGIFRLMGFNEITGGLIRTEECTEDGYRRLWDTSPNGEYNKWGSIRVKYREGAAFISIQAYAGDEATGARTLWFGGSDSELPGGIKDLTSANSSIPVRETTGNGQTTFRNTVAGTVPLIANHAGGSSEIQKWQTSGTTRGAVYSSTANFQVVAKNGTDLCLSNAPDDGAASAVIRWRVAASDNSFRPGADNAYSVGSAAARPSQIFAAAGTINTSDEREKTPLRPLTEAERAAVLEIKNSIGAFLFKGRKRIHFGVGAQTAGAIMRKHGLDPQDYAFWCYDEWDEQPEEWEEWGDEFDHLGQLIRPAGKMLVQEYRPAGNRHGIRYEELLAYIIAAL